MESEGFHKIMAYFPDNLVNLPPVPDEPHCVGTITTAATILALPLMVELDAYVHYIMESVGELLLIRSFSVEADNLPTVEAGCIYFMKQNLANNKQHVENDAPLWMVDGEVGGDEGMAEA
uniref:Uncharacterized protein n=1 Tax=Oryza sativa subsp. japonica TaxID=39947 RepID=Q6Z9G6_ORYSJ|nr:hypothetical protein [Oryza sativa Japonica Group]BAD09905.1 hypothetical protein [Oryza sativa Japonica Group]